MSTVGTQFGGRYHLSVWIAGRQFASGCKVLSTVVCTKVPGHSMFSFVGQLACLSNLNLCSASLATVLMLKLCNHHQY